METNDQIWLEQGLEEESRLLENIALINGTRRNSLVMNI
jgi:hypothetical protein